MGRSFANHVDAGQGDSPDLLTDSRSDSLDLLALVIKALADTQCSQDALAAYRGDKDASFVGKVLRREKPLGVSFLLGLPPDVAARFTKLYAEAYGHIVVLPVSRDEAARMFVAGMFGMFGLVASPALPEKAGAMAQAGLSATAKRKVG